MAVKNITDIQKMPQVLCISIGSVHYNNLSDLLGPSELIKYLPYPELIAILQEMLALHISLVVSQH